MPVSRRGATVLVSAALAVTMSGTTLPTPLYAIYQREFGFSTFISTVIFAAYALGVILALVLLGRVSDLVGRRPVLLAGLVAATLSAVTFLNADGVPLLVAGRVLSGISAGIFTGTATAALVDLADAGGSARATVIATSANMGGLGLGPLLAGTLAQSAPSPLLLPFALHLALLLVVAAGIWVIPETVETRGRLHIPRPRLSVPTQVREVFTRAALAGFAGFAVLGLFTAVAPLFLHRLLGLSSPGVAGAVVFLVFLASAAGQVFVVPVLGGRAMRAGTAALIGGLGLLAAALAAKAIVLLLAAGALVGLGQGAAFRGGLTEVNAQAPAATRAEVASSFFVVMYLGISVPVVGVGVAATSLGLRGAGIAFCGVTAALALLAILLPEGRSPVLVSPNNIERSTR